MKTVSRSAQRWYVSITVEMPEGPVLPPAKNQGAAGADPGLTNMVTLSTGEVVTGPMALRRLPRPRWVTGSRTTGAQRARSWKQAAVPVLAS